MDPLWQPFFTRTEEGKRKKEKSRERFLDGGWCNFSEVPRTMAHGPGEGAGEATIFASCAF
jgi:hypothetical protein